MYLDATMEITLISIMTTINYIISLSSANFCIQPPMECPNVNITFWLYTRKNIDKPHQLFAKDPGSITSAPWVEGAPVKILIHGYTGHKDFSPNTEIRPAYMQCCNYNIISVDYGPLVRKSCYLWMAVNNSELVGKCTAQLVDELVANHSIPLSRIHPVGFSLGGQVLGFLANHLKSGKFDRITALDPALPLYITNDVNMKVDASDARFVDVLHTNALMRGQLEPTGTVDFYSNGGSIQPGCYPNGSGLSTEDLKISSCSHARAPQYYAESLLNGVGFWAQSCSSLRDYMSGECKLISDDEVLFGEYVPLNASGLYFFNTTRQSPYARGHKKVHKLRWPRKPRKGGNGHKLWKPYTYKKVQKQRWLWKHKKSRCKRRWPKRHIFRFRTT